MSIHPYVYTYTHVHAYKHDYMYVTFMEKNTRTHTHTHTHTHTKRQGERERVHWHVYILHRHTLNLQITHTHERPQRKNHSLNSGINNRILFQRVHDIFIESSKKKKKNPPIIPFSFANKRSCQSVISASATVYGLSEKQHSIVATNYFIMLHYQCGDHTPLAIKQTPQVPQKIRGNDEKKQCVPVMSLCLPFLFL